MTPMIMPPKWTVEQFRVDRLRAIEEFSELRLGEPLESYTELFDEYKGVFEDLIELTVDLTMLVENGLQILTDKRLMEALRYLTGPPISTDDLTLLAGVERLSNKRFQADEALVHRVINIVRDGLDRRRFEWVADDREPNQAEKEAAIVASAALLAAQRLGTSRRHGAKRDQERLVESALTEAGFTMVGRLSVRVLTQGPGLGQFCGESKLGTRKADFLVRLWDDRLMAIECKVSNSALNSIKRLNNDAAVKAEVWHKDFGATQVIPAAIISGVYKLDKLEEAQRRGLAIFWAHDMAEMIGWIERTRIQ